MTKIELHPWEVVGHMDATGYTPTIGFVWTEKTDKADAKELACLHYGRKNVFDVWESRFGSQTPPTGFVPKE